MGDDGFDPVLHPRCAELRRLRSPARAPPPLPRRALAACQIRRGPTVSVQFLRRGGPSRSHVPYWPPASTRRSPEKPSLAARAKPTARTVARCCISPDTGRRDTQADPPNVCPPCLAAGHRAQIESRYEKERKERVNGSPWRGGW